MFLTISELGRLHVQVEVGSLLGGCYQVLGSLGEGGMASVYRATHIVTGREVALKVLREPEAPEQRREMRQLFEREFMTLAQVSHPRVVAGYDYGIDPQAGPFYAMELLDGGDLHQRTPLPWREACAVARDVCAALVLLHSRRLVYRDLSPKNVRCTTSGTAKLIDFGAMTAFGMPSETVGTPPFVAPEALSAQPLDGRTDLYALGATLYYALTGYHAYPARNMAQLWELWRTSPTPPSSYVAAIPEALDRLVMQLIQHDPGLRPADAAEVMQRLEALAGLPADQALHVAHAYLVAPKLVGRDKVLRKLRDARAVALGGRASAVLVSGPHGVGRSRLLEESLLQAKVQGFVSVGIQGAEVLDREYALLGALAESVLCALPEVARHALEPHRAVLAPFLPRRDPDAGDAPASLPPAQRHAAVQAAACEWLATIARRHPLCILLDDAVRFDVPSLALLANLLRETANAPIALVWSASNEERVAADWPAALVLLERASSVISLPALGPGETEELLSAVFGEVPNLPQLASYVQHTAAGNPRDTLQLLQFLVSEGVLKHAAGAWSLPAHWSATGLPSSMLHALEQRAQKLGPAAQLLAFAFAAEPRQRFSLEECELLLEGIAGADRERDLRQCREADVLEPAGAGYRLAQLGFAAALARVTSERDQCAQHRRLARLFEQRGDGFHAAQHLLRADDQVAGLDLLIQTSIENKLRTDADMRVYFETMRALPADWLALFQEGVRLCEVLQRPAVQRDALLSRAAAFIPLAKSSGGGDGFALLKLRLDRLVRDVGLDLYASLPESMDAGARLKTALEQAKQRYDATPANERVFEPLSALRELSTSLLLAIAMTSVTNSAEAQRQLPRLDPLVALSPTLWLVQQTSDGVGARLEGRFELAAQIYRGILARMELPDRAGLHEAENRSTRLRIGLSLGTVEACMGLPSALGTADLVHADRDYETQGLMLRHLSELWLGRLSEAASTRHAIEQARAFSTVHGNYEGQHLLAELSAQGLLNDLTGLRQSAEAAKRIADLHPSWGVVVHYCQGEYEFSRGDLAAALERLEQTLAEIGRPRDHQLWPNAAGAHLRVLTELGRHDQARELGAHYLAQAESAGLGYLCNYIRIPLSVALAASDMALAVALAERAVDEFRALGSTGLNLVYALENRARLALLARDSAGFERFAALSSAENPALSRRLRRGHISAAQRDAGSDGASASMLLSELSSALNGSSEIGERSRRALRVLNRHTDARGAACYMRGADGLERVASAGELPHLDELDRWAQAYFEGQLLAHHASTSQFDELTEIVPTAYGIPAGMYVPQMIGHHAAAGYEHTGLIVLAMPVATGASWMTAFTETLSRSLDTRA